MFYVDDTIIGFRNPGSGLKEKDVVKAELMIDRSLVGEEDIRMTFDTPLIVLIR